MSEHNLATLYELSRHLRLPFSWLLQETKAGRIPSLRAGRRWLFSIEAVKRVLAERAAAGAGSSKEGDAK